MFTSGQPIYSFLEIVLEDHNCFQPTQSQSCIRGRHAERDHERTAHVLCHIYSISVTKLHRWLVAYFQAKADIAEDPEAGGVGRQRRTSLLHP